MLGLVARLGKVEIVRYGMFLVAGSQADLHVELTPSFLCDPERRVLEGCCREFC